VRRIVVSGTICGKASDLFEWSQNTERRSEWDTFVSKIQWLEGETGPRVSAAARVHSKDGVSIVARRVSFQPARRTEFVMEEGPAFLRALSGEWTFSQIDACACRVAFVYSFAVRPRALRELVEPWAAWWLRRRTQARWNAFKTWAQTRAAAQKIKEAAR